MIAPRTASCRLAAIFAVSTLTVMSAACIAPALTEIAKALGDTQRVAFWVRVSLTFPTLFSAIGAPIAGRLIDRHGRRQPLLAALVVYALAGLCGGLAPNVAVLMVTRGILGCSVAVIMVTAVTLIADYYPVAARQRVFSWQSAMMSIGGFVYLCLSGLLADISWRMAFVVYGVALLFWPLVWLGIDEPEQAAERRKHTNSDDSGPTDWRLILISVAAAFAGMVAFYMVPVQLPFYLQHIQPGISSFTIGWTVAFMPLAVGVAALCYAAVRQRLDVALLFALVFTLIAVGYLWIANASGLVSLVPGLIVAGAGIGLLFPHLSNTVSAVADSTRRGQMLGVVNTAIFLGQFLSPFVTEPSVATNGAGATFAIVGRYCAFIMLACLALAVWRRRAWRRE